MTYRRALADAARQLADRIDALALHGTDDVRWSDAHCWDDGSPEPRWIRLAATLTHDGWRIVPVARLADHIDDLRAAVDRRLCEENAGRAMPLNLDACLDDLVRRRLRGAVAALDAATRQQQADVWP